MSFSAPPDAQGHAGVLTPEDAFVAAANTCVMLMFIWAAERFHHNLQSYECRTEGTKLIELYRTEIFTRLLFRPVIRVATITITTNNSMSVNPILDFIGNLFIYHS